MHGTEICQINSEIVNEWANYNCEPGCSDIDAATWLTLHCRSESVKYPVTELRRSIIVKYMTLVPIFVSDIISLSTENVSSIIRLNWIDPWGFENSNTSIRVWYHMVPNKPVTISDPWMSFNYNYRYTIRVSNPLTIILL